MGRRECSAAILGGHRAGKMLAVRAGQECSAAILAATGPARCWRYGHKAGWKPALPGAGKKSTDLNGLYSRGQARMPVAT